MKIHRHNETMKITGLRELCAANAQTFREQACAALDQDLTCIEIDLSQVPFVDSCALGALVSLHKVANRDSANDRVTISLLDPTPPVQQVFELTRMHCLFEIVQRQSPATEEPAAAPATPVAPPPAAVTATTASPL